MVSFNDKKIETNFTFKDSSNKISSMINIQNNNSYQTDYIPKQNYNKFNINNNENEIENNNNNNFKYKTELCKFYEMNNYCKFGENCIFAHGKENLREDKLKKSGYKKRPCQNFFENGFCLYGNRCQFSHNIKEYKFVNKLNYNKNYNNNNKNNNNNKFLYSNLFDINYYKKIDNSKDIYKYINRLKIFKSLCKIKKSKYVNNKNYIEEIKNFINNKDNQDNNNNNNNNSFDSIDNIIFNFKKETKEDEK